MEEAREGVCQNFPPGRGWKGWWSALLSLPGPGAGGWEENSEIKGVQGRAPPGYRSLPDYPYPMGFSSLGGVGKFEASNELLETNRGEAGPATSGPHQALSLAYK